MKKILLFILLYGVAIIVILMALLHLNSLMLPKGPIYKEAVTELRRLRLPVRVEDSILDFLNQSLEHQVINRTEEGRVLTRLLNTNSTSDQLPPWKQFLDNISSRLFYSEDDPVLDQLREKMRKLNILGITEHSHSGTEFKFFMELYDGTPIVAKPMRLSVDKEPLRNMSKNDFFERFQSEVAAFHLSRILKLHFVPPAVSRYLDLKSEIQPVAPDELNKTFFNREDGATCFTGNCAKKCDVEHAICGYRDVIACSLAFLVPKTVFTAGVKYAPYWLRKHSDYCRKLREKTAKISNATRMFLDTVDISVFDYIQGNLDRHHFGRIKQFGNDGPIILYDNGRGFARSYQDEYDLLKPLFECCQIRLSTFTRLWHAYQSERSLAEAMKMSLRDEVVQPLLTESHLAALDRRLIKVMEIVYGCMERHQKDKLPILVNDGY